ncbi:glycosyltransferase family 4 protein [Helicobacter sp. MIT 21-1697]|uniref:glycosyltransferase family 4 protein n=1 Tax=Helicobacter sp. MIT 21-1697 TaxID=2993733 RepID=UPI00224A5879|nr:glycosyltransferase family 4 protein [Helicobacter sp. MIT 21-1697]MCX2717776.1 glycosyltransferase family 4 protein [Helicobacter sp. MIT 21-1697]
MKKILLTIGDISITGGAERVVVNLANALSEKGHNVEILSFYQTNETLPYHIDENIKLHFWHNISESTLREQMCRNKLSKIYYKNAYKFMLSLRVYRTYAHFDSIIANDSTYIPFIKHKWARYIRLIHLNFGVYNRRNNFFHTLIILSAKELSLWQSYRNNVKVIPNFLPALPTKSTDTTQKRILSVGRMDRGDQKGFLRLIDIWALAQKRLQSSMPPPPLHSWQLIIVGEGEMKTQIESKIKEKNLQDSILLKPFTQNIESEYLNASIYAMSSHYEGFPMVLLESCSFGLCPIAFDIKTGPSEIIEDSKTGFLVQDNDLQGFADKLIELMSDESKRKTLGEAAKIRVTQRLSKQAIMPLWEEVLGGK